MAQILVISRQAAHYGELLAAEGIEVACFTDVESARESASSAEILFGAPDLLADLLPHCQSVRWVQSSWAGITPLVDCPRRDYLLSGVKDIFGAPMIEFVLGWLLAIERRIPERFRARRWDDQPDGSTYGKRIGIMGTGSIGYAVGRGCHALGLTVHGLNSDGRVVSGFASCWPLSQRLDFARGLDYLVALLPDTPETDRLVDADLLQALNPGAVFINAGRGNVVAMEALLAALDNGRLRHAVLDVLPKEPLPEDDPLWHTEGLSITSHTAAPTSPAAIVAVFCDNYRRYLAGESLRYPVDLSRGY